ncbi:MAG: hypothetical protein KKD07_01045 [Candidatus Omnitrophica bacterium]|nr:hypothetical protein [Candidatus Omnitrophota bacterium]MBU1996295.1 hypothetical protein [Candidatus Omnitrophota bacterium]MBU4333009.1 hypothetical protein [Candidatus Omnitrophota bacterium]
MQKNVALVVFCLSVLSIRVSFADSIKLMSGKVFEGEIIERTQEHIKMNTNLGVVTIPIKRIDPDSFSNGGADGVISEEEKAESYKVDDWDQWMAQNQGYLDIIGEMQLKYLAAMEESTINIGEALGRKDIKAGKAAANKARSRLSVLQEEVSKVQPPEELKGFHEKIKQTYSYANKSINMWLITDQQAYYKYYKRSQKAYISSVIELKDFYKYNEAPAEVVEVMEKAVKTFQTDLENSFY